VLFPGPGNVDQVGALRRTGHDGGAQGKPASPTRSTTLVGDAQKQKAQADQCLGNGAKVLVEVALDAGSASAIEQTAKAKGVPSIDYDRQVRAASRRIYVSFDGGAVGVLQGKGGCQRPEGGREVLAAPVVAEVNGGSTDANSFPVQGRVRLGPEAALQDGTFKKGPDQFVPFGWDNQKGGVIFDQMLVKTGNTIDAVAAAERRSRRRVIASLAKHGLKPIPVSGQDATPQGFQNIISGWQTMTVLEDTRVLAKAAAKAAVQRDQGSEADGHRFGAERQEEGAGIHHSAGRALQVELDEDLHVRLPQEERHLHGYVQEVLQVTQ